MANTIQDIFARMELSRRPYIDISHLIRKLNLAPMEQQDALE
jgi:hypothetical protein